MKEEVVVGIMIAVFVALLLLGVVLAIVFAPEDRTTTIMLPEAQ